MRNTIKHLFYKTAVIATVTALLFSPAFADTGTVNTDALNVRSAAGTDSSVLGMLNEGKEVEILGSEGDWYSIDYNGQTAYVYASYISLGETASATESKAAYTNDDVNFRESASTTSASLAYLDEGTDVTVTGESGNWYAVTCNGQSGYIYKDYITIGATSSGAVESSMNEAGVINDSAVRFRSSAGTGSTIYGTFNKGAKVTVTGKTGDWYAVSYNGRSGYIYSEYVTLDSSSNSSETETFSYSGETGTINDTYVRLRSGAGTSSNILKVLNKGDTMTVTGESGDWYAVTYNGQSGYVYKTYLSLGSSSSSSYDSWDGYINDSAVRFRAGSSTSSNILSVFDKGDSLSVTGEEGDWYAVTYNGQSGYVYKSYVSSGTYSDTSDEVTADSGTGTINSDYVRIRKAPSLSASIITLVNEGTSLQITGYTDEWYQVNYNGQTGYVYRGYLSKESETASSSYNNSKADELISIAESYLGVPYVYGGTSPSGFDCSGFVYYVFKQLGTNLYRTATAQYSNGDYVSRSDLQPGDIIIFYDYYMSSIGHSAIYIGNNQFIHASSAAGEVKISSLSETYYDTHFYGARRVL